MVGMRFVRGGRRASRCRLRGGCTGRVVTSFGSDYATVSTEFTSDATALLGRQMQTWARVGAAAEAHQGWKIVAAHVSLIATA